MRDHPPALVEAAEHVGGQHMAGVLAVRDLFPHQVHREPALADAAHHVHAQLRCDGAVENGRPAVDHLVTRAQQRAAGVDAARVLVGPHGFHGREIAAR
jgi:hypothetical protein